jgi:hypothetical protein
MMKSNLTKLERLSTGPSVLAMSLLKSLGLNSVTFELDNLQSQKRIVG